MLSLLNKELKNLMQDSLHDVHTAIPGRIENFDPIRCEADVLPYGKYKKPNGELVDYPMCPGVPVMFPQGAGQTATIAFPVKQGDECLLLFAEQALDTWKTGASSTIDLRHDLTNAVAIVGLYAQPNALVREAVAQDALIIDKNGQRVLLKQNNVEVTGVNVTIKARGDISMSAGGSISMQSKNMSVNAEKTISFSAPLEPDGVFSAVGWTAGMTQLKP